MAFRVELTTQAHLDATAILEWLISEHAGETGLRWFEGMEEAIASLDTFPDRCPLVPESQEFPFEVRQLLYGRKPNVYRILFTIEADTVRVLSIRAPRRQHVTRH